MNTQETVEVENIVRNLKKAINIAQEIENSGLVDFIQQSLDFAQGILPDGNRHKTSEWSHCAICINKEACEAHGCLK